jgi:3-dehydroquinate synthase
MAIFHVPLKKRIDDSYDIEIGRNLFASLISDLKHGMIRGVNKYALITDSNVEKLYGQTLLAELKSNGFNADIFTFKAGEVSKTRETKAKIEDLMIDLQFGRDSCVIALGGGVVTDLAGFIAGTFCRGIPFINYATTLMAAADASIGGKTAVDTPRATNLIGLFHQPQKVYIDIDAWQTLPLSEIRCGLAETIKHACLADTAFFAYLEEHIDEITAAKKSGGILPQRVCEHIAHKNCSIKYKVVKHDEKEKNPRQILNLGHTIGRALEPVSGYNLMHGEAVAIGIAVQTRLGVNCGYLKKEEAKRVVSLLERAGLPVAIPASIDKEILIAKLYTDKKVRRDKIRFVFQKGIGAMMRFKDGSYSKEVAEDEIRSVL